MTLFEPLRMGLEQLRVHKMRASLSILGILISVGSVVGIVSMGDGLRITILDKFQQMGGSNLVFVRLPSQNYRNQYGVWVQRDWEDHLTNDDLAYFAEELENIKYIIPRVNLNQTVSRNNASASANIRASNEHYYLTEDWEVGTGRMINRYDVANASKVAVIGKQLAEDLFGRLNPVGRELKVGGSRYTVVGVLKENDFFGNTSARNMWIPYTTAQLRFNGNDYVSTINVWADSPDDTQSVARQIRMLLRRTHDHGADIIVETAESEVERFNQIMLILKIVAGGIAGISLVVGGIGIMNIMLVSVSERTREIGIRMALGAKRSAIMSQFIIEAVVLCLFGGILGIALGMMLGGGISLYVKSLTDQPFESIITPGLMTFSILYSAAIGMFFGVYPAWRASKLDPVEALRYE